MVTRGNDPPSSRLTRWRRRRGRRWGRKRLRCGRRLSRGALCEDGSHALRIGRERIEKSGLYSVVLQYPGRVARVIGLDRGLSAQNVQTTAQVHQQVAGAATERLEHDHQQAWQDMGIDRVIDRRVDGSPQRAHGSSV